MDEKEKLVMVSEIAMEMTKAKVTRKMTCWRSFRACVMYK